MTPMILVVEDHPEMSSLITRTLRPQGYDVVTVADGETALTVAEAQPPDLVIADVQLPGMDGLTVVATLRRQEPLLPVIVISAVCDVLEDLKVIPAGLDLESMSFLPKPFGLRSLMDLVDQLLPLPLMA